MLVWFVVLPILIVQLAILLRGCRFSNRDSDGLTSTRVGFCGEAVVLGGFAGVAATVANVFVAEASVLLHTEVRVATSGGVVRDFVTPVCWFSSHVTRLVCKVVNEVSTRSVRA